MPGVDEHAVSALELVTTPGLSSGYEALSSCPPPDEFYSACRVFGTQSSEAKAPPAAAETACDQYADGWNTFSFLAGRNGRSDEESIEARANLLADWDDLGESTSGEIGDLIRNNADSYKAFLADVGNTDARASFGQSHEYFAEVCEIEGHPIALR